mmetsp:Transcript_26706/g.100447  ORF Transcript_26706/g.100447 Transcript_26706/m.100447 type:complete len:212 (-) Transcript_26706:211-846(-)
MPPPIIWASPYHPLMPLSVRWTRHSFSPADTTMGSSNMSLLIVGLAMPRTLSFCLPPSLPVTCTPLRTSTLMVQGLLQPKQPMPMMRTSLDGEVTTASKEPPCPMLHPLWTGEPLKRLTENSSALSCSVPCSACPEPTEPLAAHSAASNAPQVSCVMPSAGAAAAGTSGAADLPAAAAFWITATALAAGSVEPGDACSRRAMLASRRATTE